MIVIENYDEMPADSNIIASFDVYLPAAELRLRKLKVMKGKNGYWVAFPCFKQTGGDKDNWVPYFSFSAERQKEFLNQVTELLKDYVRMVSTK